MTQTIHATLPQFEVFTVALLRVTAILSAFPILGARAVPAMIKIGLAVALALVTMPFLVAVRVPADPTAMAVGMAAEIGVGVVIGLIARCLFAGFEFAGEIMSNQMGLSAAQMIDPTSSHQVPVLGQFQSTIASLLFLTMNLHLVVVHALVESFRLIPPFGASLSEDLLDIVLHAFQNVLVVGVKLAAPVIVVTLVVNLVMAMLGRTVSQLNVFVLTFPLTIACGLLAIGVSLPALSGAMMDEFETMMRTLDHAMGVLGRG
ncbi:MAG: flagellar biosynthetic protein FliR [Nitrospiraceae bacterium]